MSKDETREKLILVAERLIAQHGVEGVSLRKVNMEAGQKNTAAALYHFGDKEGLIKAIFEYRMEHVEQRRHELIDSDGDSVRGLIKAWVLPDVEEISHAEGGSFHARFLAIVSNHPSFDFRSLWDSPHATSYQRISKRLRELLPNIPEPVLGMRFGLAMIQSIYALAEREHLLEGKLDRSHVSGASEENVYSPLFINVLIDAMEAMITSPMSDQVIKEI